MQDILVYTPSFKQPWARSIEYGGRLAASLGASLTGAYVYPSPLYTAPPYASHDLISAIFENARALEAAAQAAQSPFEHWARSLGIANTSWHVAEGYLPEALAHIGTWHDLLVLELDGDKPWGSAPDVASLILASHLPCIVVPAAEARAALDCIVLAWNGAPEAVRAIHASIPLLARARRVVLLRGQRRNAFLDVTWKPPFDVVQYLGRHGIDVESKDIGADDEHAGEAILAEVAKLGADLLVMGAYGRSRFSEWALGGATRHVLDHAALPVFMRH